MKRLFCILMLVLMLCGSVHAEVLPDLTLVTPMPTAMPSPTEFACEAFIVNLPAGMEIIDMSALEGYAAAAQELYPGDGLIQLAAVNPDTDAALCFILMESDQTPLDAAKEAALQITGSADHAAEYTFGANSCAGFNHAVDETQYSLYFFSNASSLLLISSIGLDAAQLDSMLTSLDF